MAVLKLKEHRMKKNKTQVEIATIMNITQAQYSRWENEINFPNPIEIVMLCDIFDCTPNDLFNFNK